MGGALLSAFVVAAVSAFVPVTPVEPYLVALAAADQPVMAVSLAAALGQTAGKVLIFLAARNTLRSQWLRRWLTRRERSRPRRPTTRRRRTRTRRWLSHHLAGTRRWIALLDRPALVVPTILVSAATGIPPLLAVSVHAARTPVSTAVFALCCLAGRAVRFAAVMLAPGLL
jgi:membrane protein YqaA with SNARE-associated domain